MYVHSAHRISSEYLWHVSRVRTQNVSLTGRYPQPSNIHPYTTSTTCTFRTLDIHISCIYFCWDVTFVDHSSLYPFMVQSRNNACYYESGLLNVMIYGCVTCASFPCFSQMCTSCTIYKCTTCYAYILYMLYMHSHCVPHIMHTFCIPLIHSIHVMHTW